MAGCMPIRILQVVNHMDYGGVEAVIMNYYRHMDRQKVQFDFAISEDSLFPQREEIQSLGKPIPNRTLSYEQFECDSALRGISGEGEGTDLS